MTKLTIPIGVALLASLTTAHADMYLYSCKVGKKNLPLVVDDEANSLSWNQVEYKGITNANEGEIACARSGWHVAVGEDSFDFCTATQGTGYIQKLDKPVAQCQLQTTFVSQVTFDAQNAAAKPVEPPVAAAPNSPPASPKHGYETLNDYLRDGTNTKPIQPSSPSPSLNKTLQSLFGDNEKPARMISPSEYHAPPPPEPAPVPQTPPVNSVEELSCNSDTVKRILVNGTVNKTASESAKLAQLFKNNAQLYADLVQVSRWSGTVVNVRETSRAPGKVSCAAEFEWQNMPSKQAMANVGVILLAQGIEDKSCIKVNYQVQPLLDKPGQINVSWRCNDG